MPLCSDSEQSYLQKYMPIVLPCAPSPLPYISHGALGVHNSSSSSQSGPISMNMLLLNTSG